MKLQTQNELSKLDAHMGALIHELSSLNSIKEKFLTVDLALQGVSHIEKQIVCTMNDILEKLKQKRENYEKIREELKNLMILRGY